MEVNQPKSREEVLSLINYWEKQVELAHEKEDRLVSEKGASKNPETNLAYWKQQLQNFS